MIRAMPDRPTKITFAEMRDMGVRGILIYCADYRCSHLIAVGADEWPDDLRLQERRNRLEAVEPAASSFALAPASPAGN